MRSRELPSLVGGANGSSKSDWQGWKTGRDADGRVCFPPRVVVEVKALTCEFPDELGLPFSRLVADVGATPFGTIMFWGNVVLWCGLWPWILTAFHKRFAARCLERLLREELEDCA